VTPKAENQMQQHLSCQAFLPHLDFHRQSLAIMPTRQEVFEGLRSLSEEVLESLRILFCMLFALTKAISPEEQVTEQDVTPINRLIQEVRTQRQKISELGQIIAIRFTDPQARSSGPQSPGTRDPTDLWEIMDEEEELMVPSVPPMSVAGAQSAPDLGISPPMVLPKTLPSPLSPVRGPTTKIAGMPISGRPSGSPSTAMAAQIPPNHQVALTQQALTSWGQKKVTWGKKHPGKTYQVVYDGDQGYVKWVMARLGNLSEDVEDFANYAVTRQRLEMAAMNVNSQ